MYQYFWGPKEPCPCPEKKCVIMDRSLQGLYNWKPANCSEKHRHICVTSIQGNSSQILLGKFKTY